MVRLRDSRRLSVAPFFTELCNLFLTLPSNGCVQVDFQHDLARMADKVDGFVDLAELDVARVRELDNHLSNTPQNPPG